MSKYIDLLPTMLAEMPAYETDIRRVLKWLDDHPEQLPGRTITGSEIDNHIAIDITMRNGFILGFEAAGGRVVPDPEPTNAEKLKALCSDWTIGRNCLEDEDLSDYLDRLGVKAPGGDDDL